MIYPIVAYGDPILRKKAKAIAPGTDVTALTRDLMATMERAQGVGLAAPQVGQSVRMFVASLAAPNQEAIPVGQHSQVFINPEVTIDMATAPTSYEEGCLSIPGVIVPVMRREQLFIRFFDENWQYYEETYTGFVARVLQHEYDHLEGTLHIDYATPLRKKRIQGKLNDIKKGKVDTPYTLHCPG